MSVLESYQEEVDLLEKVIWNEQLKVSCTIRDFLAKNFPQVGFVEIRNHSLEIYINTPNRTVEQGIDITIRDDNWRQPNEVDLKLSWLTTQVDVNTEKEYLDYLEVLGYIATEFKNENSEFTAMVKSGFTKISTFTLQLDKVRYKVRSIKSAIEHERTEHTKALFEESLKEGEFFVKPFEKNGKQNAHVIFIKRITDKTVTYSSSEYITRQNSISILKRSDIKPKRTPKEEFFYKFKDYTIIDEEELNTLIMYNEINNEIKEYLHWNDMNSLDVPFKAIILLRERGIIKDDVTKEISERIELAITEYKKGIAAKAYN